MIDLSAVDVKDLVVQLGLGNPHPASGGQEIKFDCFGPEHSDGGAAYINRETTAWMCQGCKRRGNAVSLVMEVHQVERATAERFLREHYGIDFLEPQGGSMVAETDARFRPVLEPPPILRPSPSWLLGARLDWATDDPEPFQSYMLSRGFDAAVLAEWDIGYDFLTDRVTIPVFDVDGTFVGIKARDWTGQRKPKYLILGDRPGMTNYGFAPYEASEVVFGLHRNRDCRTVVILEGELNSIALSQIGVERPVASGMSYFSERHAQLIVQEADEAIVLYDTDTAGVQGVWGVQGANGRFRPGVVQMLEPHTLVRVAQALPEDPASLLELGRGDEYLDIIDNAQSALALSLGFG